MNRENHDDIYQIVMNNMIVALNDMNTILKTTDVATLEATINHMADFLPNLKNIPATTHEESLQKTIKNMSTAITHDWAHTSPQVNDETLREVIRNMVDTTATMINVLMITNGAQLQKTLENLRQTIPKVVGTFSEINWELFNPTDEDVKKAKEILNSEDIEQAIVENIDVPDFYKEVNNTLKTVFLVLMLLYYTVEFISNSVTLTARELTNTHVHPPVASFNQSKQQEQKEKYQENLQQLSQSLKNEEPTELHNLFMIVSHMNLILFDQPKMDSTRIGIINSTNIVQCIERKEDWTHILYDNPRNDEVLEGWVLTKYLKKIQ